MSFPSAPFAPRTGRRGMVTSADQLASIAGVSALERGGTAADAAVAAAAVMAVTGPHLCGMGGDLLAMVDAPGAEPRALLAVDPRPGSDAGRGPGGHARPRRCPHRDRARRGGRLVGAPRSVRPPAPRHGIRSCHRAGRGRFCGVDPPRALEPPGVRGARCRRALSQRPTPAGRPGPASRHRPHASRRGHRRSRRAVPGRVRTGSSGVGAGRLHPGRPRAHRRRLV
jgi:hypothetical protein